MKYLKKFNEEFKSKDLDKNTLETVKYNLLFKLKEYNQSILDDLENYRIDIRTMMRELENEFTKDFIEEIGIRSFLDSLESSIKTQNRNEIIKLFKHFVGYIKNL